jgi:hypothetical protein
VEDDVSWNDTKIGHSTKKFGILDLNRRALQVVGQSIHDEPWFNHY